MANDLTLGRWIRDRRVSTPDRIALDADGRTTTYEELDLRSEALAPALPGHGARVAVLADNRPETVEVFFACAKAGAMLLPLNRRLAPAELAYQLDHAQVDLLLVAPGYEALAEAACAEADGDAPRAELSRDGLEALNAGRTSSVTTRVSDDDPVLLVYTSGTTGRPKGALLTHANCFWTNLSLDRTIDVTTTDVVLQVLPQFHVGGWNVQPLLAWWKGATVVLEREFDPVRTLELIAARGVTTMMGVPAIYQQLAATPGFDTTDLTSLRQAVVGGAPMPEPLIATWLERGVTLVQGYGLTEASPNVLGLPAEHVTDRVGYAGRPYPHVEVALADTATGEHVDGPGTGELLVRGPNVFAGYWRDPAATREAFVDGWLTTGDVAERDAEGFYRIRDRTKDMYVSGGENVYPAEVESVLHAHPAVADAAVIGVPDERWGEAGLAVVVLAGDERVDAATLHSHCAERLARFKVPREVVFVDELPRSSLNKVLKTELAERFVGRAP